VSLFTGYAITLLDQNGLQDPATCVGRGCLAFTLIRLTSVRQRGERSISQPRVVFAQSGMEFAKYLIQLRPGWRDYGLLTES